MQIESIKVIEQNESEVIVNSGNGLVKLHLPVYWSQPLSVKKSININIAEAVLNKYAMSGIVYHRDDRNIYISCGGLVQTFPLNMYMNIKIGQKIQIGID